MERTLNIPEPQVLVHFPGDPNGLNYHHRVLLHKISPGKWVTLTPDLDLEIHDLNVRRHVVLGRHSGFPDQYVDEAYVFEEISRNELERQKRLAKTMGSILDDGEIADVAASNGSWLTPPPAVLENPCRLSLSVTFVASALTGLFNGTERLNMSVR